MSLLLLFKPSRAHLPGWEKPKKRGRKKKDEKFTVKKTKKGIKVFDAKGKKVEIDADFAEGLLLFLMLDDD